MCEVDLQASIFISDLLVNLINSRKLALLNLCMKMQFMHFVYFTDCYFIRFTTYKITIALLRLT